MTRSTITHIQGPNPKAKELFSVTYMPIQFCENAWKGMVVMPGANELRLGQPYYITEVPKNFSRLAADAKQCPHCDASEATRVIIAANPATGIPVGKIYPKELVPAFTYKTEFFEWLAYVDHANCRLLFFIMVRDQEKPDEIQLKAIPIGIDLTSFTATDNRDREQSLRILTALASPHQPLINHNVTKERIYLGKGVKIPKEVTVQQVLKLSKTGGDVKDLLGINILLQNFSQTKAIKEKPTGQCYQALLRQLNNSRKIIKTSTLDNPVRQLHREKPKINGDKNSLCAAVNSTSDVNQSIYLKDDELKIRSKQPHLPIQVTYQHSEKFDSASQMKTRKNLKSQDNFRSCTSESDQQYQATPKKSLQSSTPSSVLVKPKLAKKRKMAEISKTIRSDRDSDLAEELLSQKDSRNFPIISLYNELNNANNKTYYELYHIDQGSEASMNYLQRHIQSIIESAIFGKTGKLDEFRIFSQLYQVCSLRQQHRDRPIFTREENYSIHPDLLKKIEPKMM